MKRISWIAVLCWFFAGSVAWGFGGDEEPLKPEEAFKLRAYAKNPSTVTAEWQVMDGYYLYQGRFKFSTDTPGYTLGEPVFPKGKVKQDEFFGEVITHRHTVKIDIPVSREAGAPESLVLKTVSQGCADAGLCYPPQTVSVDFIMPPLEDEELPLQQSGSASSISLFDKLGLGAASEDDGFLDPDLAFALSTEVQDGNTLLVHWDIADGYYLYRDRMAFSLVDAEGITLAAPVFPGGAKFKEDEYFGKMAVYYHQAPVRLPLLRTNVDPADIELKISYQGCAEKGFCYPPQTSNVLLSLPAGNEGSGTAMALSSGSGGFVSEQDSIAATLAGESLFWVVLSFFGFGLLLAFTPCVLPMVPILSSIIVGQGNNITTGKAFSMSLVYVLAMALTYTAAGVFAGLAGENLQAAFQNPWMLSIFAMIFVLLSLSMFGVYELQLPASWQARLTEMSNSQRGGTLAGVGVMGFLSALIVGPCVAAPLAGALIYIGQTGDPVRGGIALFALSMGMGAPLLAIGTSAGKLLPKAGAWMETVKMVFGILLLGVAIWMLERVLPAGVTMLLWGTLLIGAAIILGVFKSGRGKAWRVLGALVLAYGALLMIGSTQGVNDPLHPMRVVFFDGKSGQQEGVAFKRIKSLQDLESEIQSANAAGKPVMLDFYADWCVSCKEMEHYVFTDDDVKNTLSQVVLLQADVTKNDDVDKALMKELGIIGPPAILFFDDKGQERRRQRVVGFMPASEFNARVRRALSL